MRLKDKEKAEIKEEIQKELCRRSLEDFLVFDGAGQWNTAPHLHLLCDVLQKVSKGEIKRLIVTMPPRHGKSEVISKKYPAWHVGNNPEDEIINASYSLDLSRDFSRIARDTIIEHQNIFNQQIAKDNQSAERWTLEGHRGGVTAAGVGGPITGKGAKIAIIDDPIKNAEEADSQVIRDKIWEWYRTTLYTRLTPDGRIIIVMTRWHEDDLVGRLLNPKINEKVNEWTVINFPAIAEGNDILGRHKGEALWPQYGFNINKLAQIKTDIGSRAWNALYQQRPTAEEGNLIHRSWWKYYEALPDMIQTIMSVDAAFKDGDKNDYVAIQVWGKREANIYLIDSLNEHMDFPTTLNAITTMKSKYKKCNMVLIEDKANGSAIIQMLQRKILGIIPVNPEGGKVARVNAVSPAIEAGNVWLPMNKPFTMDFVNQCSSFSNAEDDDMVDAMSQALNRFIYFQAELPPKPVHYNWEFEKPKPAYGEEIVDESYIYY
jgi:predicted phage terminase large subunit-like protein